MMTPMLDRWMMDHWHCLGPTTNRALGQHGQGARHPRDVHRSRRQSIHHLGRHSKAGVGSSTPVAPSLIETEVVHTPGQPAYLKVVAQNTAVMSNPGSNLITGDGTSNEIDWVVDEGQQRTDGTTSYSDGSPVLYAYNALTMQPLWSSAVRRTGRAGRQV